MFKRYGLLILVNILIMVVITVITTTLGLNTYYTAYGINYQQLMLFCLVWGLGGSFISLMLSKWMAKSMMGVREIDSNGPYSQIVKKVHEYSRKAGLETMPEVGIYDSPDINAFATGPSKSKSLVAVSTGLIHNMNEDEVDGVLAHEVAHIANGDMVTMTLLQGVMNAFVMFFARVIAFAIDNAMRGDRDDRGGGLGPFAHMMVVIVLQIVFGILASFVTSYFSRYREYRADSGAASLAGREKMIAALEKLKIAYDSPRLQEAVASTQDRNDNLAAFKISGRGGIMALLSTHPPLDKRINALKHNRP